MWCVFSWAMCSRMLSSFLVIVAPTSSLRASQRESFAWPTTEKGDIHAVAYTIFCCLWRLLLPSVIIMKPMTDLCWTCHQNSTAILRAANSSEMSKSTNLAEAEKHLRIVQIERSFYKTTCRETIRSYFTIDGEFQLPLLSSRITPNSNDFKAHPQYHWHTVNLQLCWKWYAIL